MARRPLPQDLLPLVIELQVPPSRPAGDVDPPGGEAFPPRSSYPLTPDSRHSLGGRTPKPARPHTHKSKAGASAELENDAYCSRASLVASEGTKSAQ